MPTPNYSAAAGGPLPLLPNQPSGAPDWYPSSSYGTSAPSATTSGSTQPSFYATDNGPVILPSEWTPETAQQWVAAYNQAIGKAQQAWQQTSGIQRRQVEAQIQSLQDAQKNAVQLARITTGEQRYATDQQRQTALDQLKQNQDQFAQTHALDMQKLGLDYANTATNYLSTKDKYFQGSNYINMASRVFAGQPGAAPYGSLGQPTPKTEQDFANLQAGGTGQQAPSSSQGMSPADVASAAAGQGGAGADARIKALKGMIDALPPSASAGLNNNDSAVLAAAHALYSTNLTPGQFATIKNNPDYADITNSGIARLGGSPDQWNAQQTQNGLGFGSARAA